jgi:hypothetical protein
MSNRLALFALDRIRPERADDRRVGLPHETSPEPMTDPVAAQLREQYAGAGEGPDK